MVPLQQGQAYSSSGLWVIPRDILLTSRGFLCASLAKQGLVRCAWLLHKLRIPDARIGCPLLPGGSDASAVQAGRQQWLAAPKRRRSCPRAKGSGPLCTLRLLCFVGGPRCNLEERSYYGPRAVGPALSGDTLLLDIRPGSPSGT